LISDLASGQHRVSNRCKILPLRIALPGLLGAPFAGWSKAKAALDKAITEARTKAAAASGMTAPPLVPWSVHDLRRTVATALQRLGVRLEVTEAVLNHISGSRGGIAGVYQRQDWAAEKRAALDAWAAQVLAIGAQRTPADNVVQAGAARLTARRRPGKPPNAAWRRRATVTTPVSADFGFVAKGFLR
jgi:hypothetical protein